jgi:HD-GYP domain-containing protein (c-di-GMP phosphodiesterase class II)
MDQLVKAVAVALDHVEGELLGASTHHGKRIASLVAAMGQVFHMTSAELSALTTCALMHDSALTEFILAEREGQETALREHCVNGQKNVEMLLFATDITGIVLYHHECADGTGAFGKKEGEYPLGAELIAIADMLDVTHHLQTVKLSDLETLRTQIAKGSGVCYTVRAADAMLAVLTEEMISGLRDGRIEATTAGLIPEWHAEISDQAIYNFAALAARIIDYKSVFTKNHSTQIAHKAWRLSGYYNYTQEERDKLFLAAALHDLGKLATPTDILEKPGKLTKAEFDIIKRHVYVTYELLKDIQGFEDICTWASNHHEKLDGSGYPFGKTAEELDFNSRLLACIDIYQAVSEARPYHPERSHEETMVIMTEMAERGGIDAGIVRDLGTALA